MPNLEFMPMDQELNRAYCQELLEEGIMPSAVVCLATADSSRVYSVIKNQRLSGLPIIDLARLEKSETPEHYVSFRLRKLFGFRLPKGTLRLMPVESNQSAYIHDIGNDAYSELHHRIYFPVVGRTDQLPERDTIRAVSREELFGNIASPQGGDVFYQLLDLHRELLFSFSE